MYINKIVRGDFNLKFSQNLFKLYFLHFSYNCKKLLATKISTLISFCVKVILEKRSKIFLFIINF